LFFLLPGLEPALHPQQRAGAPRPAYTERVRKEFKFYPGGKIQLQWLVPGNLRIIGWDRASVVLESEKVIFQLPEEEAKRLAEKLPIQVRYTQTTANIRTAGIPDSGSTVEINSTLYVPKDRTDINVSAVHGDLAIESVQGWVEATLKEGSIEAKTIAGYYSLVTQVGDVSVQMSGKHWNGMGFTAATLRGTVRLELPLDYSAALKLETRDGNFTIEYPEQIVDGESVPLVIVQNKKLRSLTASVGQGGAPIRIHTASGDIHLTAAP
jgi:DUF4097 and DUF4098 domain-containing protein YvlB